jgi:hypothetical protein
MVSTTIRMTESQWNSMPADRKGRIDSAVRYEPNRGRRRWPQGRQRADAVTDRESIGLRTLRIGPRTLVEGLGFVIVDESLV